MGVLIELGPPWVTREDLALLAKVALTYQKALRGPPPHPTHALMHPKTLSRRADRLLNGALGVVYNNNVEPGRVYLITMPVLPSALLTGGG